MKKLERLNIRIDAITKRNIETLADSYRTDPSTLVRVTMEILSNARTEHGDRLIWPPQFNYYPAAALSKQEALLLAAEDSARYEAPKKKRAG